MRAVRAANADVIYVASYPPDTAGILRAASEIGLEARNCSAAAWWGWQTAALKTQLGPLLNGVVVQQNWVPAPTLQFPGVMEFLARYQARAPAAGVDPLGVFLPPWAYARMQVHAAGDRGVPAASTMPSWPTSPARGTPSTRLSATSRLARTASGPCHG